MHVYMYSLAGTLYEGDAEVATLPAKDGEISVLDNHVPLITPLRAGAVKLRKGSGFDEEKKDFPIQGGFAQINPKEIILLVE
jgi:F-type H+-transporting ATPase subunit epsilon